jgi:tripartite-type tricarboxylate transporter receptor subunit TctC
MTCSLSRRTMTLLATSILLCSPFTFAQGPSKVTRLVVPYAAGGPVDIQARLLAIGLQAALNETIIVDNKPGAGSLIGARFVAQAPKDGKTILIGNTSTLAIAPATTKSPGYDPVKSFTPLGLIAETTSALVVHPSSPIKSAQQLIAHAKANPGKVSYASAGVGNGAHLVGELLASTAKVEMTHVPYRSGSEMMVAVLGGQVNFAVVDLTSALPAIREGKLKALGVAGPRRSPEMPNLPTMAESGFPAVSIPYWTGAAVPTGTPTDVVARLEAAIQQVTASADYRAGLKKLGAELRHTGAMEMGAMVAADFKRWGDVARQAGVSLE